MCSPSFYLNVHVSVCCAPLIESEKKKIEKENFTEMAEGATSLKGLRAQMGKKHIYPNC